MSSVQAKSKPFVYQAAMPASILLLSGLSLFYSLHNSGPVTMLPTPGSATIATVDNVQAAPQTDAVSSRLSARVAQMNTYGSVARDPAAALAQLHVSMNPVHAQQDRDRMVADLENQHQSEPVDAAWSAQSEVNVMSASITPVVLQAGFKPQDIATDCRSRTCKISARFTNASDAEDWGDRVVTQMGTTLSQVKTTVIQLPDGSSEIRMYGSRKPPAHG